MNTDRPWPTRDGRWNIAQQMPTLGWQPVLIGLGYTTRAQAQAEVDRLNAQGHHQHRVVDMKRKAA